jgi:hypothetical protein
MPSLRVVIKAVGATLLFQAEDHLEMLVSGPLYDLVKVKTGLIDHNSPLVTNRMLERKKWHPLRFWLKHLE